MEKNLFTDEEKAAFLEWASTNPVWCEKCGSDDVEHRKTLMQSHSDGSPRVHVSLVCKNCGQIATKDRYVSQAHFTPEDIEAMPIMRDNRNESHVCCVIGCNGVGVEWHHFAPRHLFKSDAENWPMDWLCTAHHIEWHRKTRTGSFTTRGKVDYETLPQVQSGT